MLACGLYPFDTKQSHTKKEYERQTIMQDNIARLLDFILPVALYPHACFSFTHPSELAGDRFFNNHSVFKSFSEDFQDFILTILHPDPSQRVPPSEVHTDPPVVALFRRFPRLCASACLNAESIENLTRSPTQAVLLKVRGCVVWRIFENADL